MTSYLALLRGVNVGGKAVLKMADLQAQLSAAGFTDVRTYIQSGNVLFTSAKTDKLMLAKDLQHVIIKHFGLTVDVAVFSHAEWQAIVSKSPEWWGKDAAWKHNLLVLTKPIPVKDVITAIGELKPGIELVEAGNGVLYQSILFEKFGRTTSGKLASNPIYKSLTIRNYNTTQKLLSLV